VNPSLDFGIHEARLDDVGAVTGTLAEGFLGGDLASWLIPDRETRRSVYAEYFWMWAEVFLRHGQVDATEDLDAVALWWPVGERLLMDIPNYDERLSKMTGEAYGRFVMLDMAMHAHHPQYRRHQYLAFIAVQPDRQGEGMASALLRYRLAQLDQEGLPAYLEATGMRNKALYERHGFRLMYPVEIPDGPELYPMWRSVRGL
jgi:GNAT superfamily N-acetyltransferase